METHGKGNFAMAITDGTLELRKYTPAAMDNVKANGSRKDFLLDAEYLIVNGILLIKGVATFTQRISGGFEGMSDMICTEKELEEALDLFYISPNLVSTKMVKKWFKKAETIVTIKKGNYLKKKGIPTIHKSSNFLIIE